MVEGDGVSIAFRREDEGRPEVKVGIACKGWQPVSKDRCKLKAKTTYWDYGW